jgi:hypothetical protein
MVDIEPILTVKGRTILMDEVSIQLKEKLEQLKIEHRDLDAVIDQLSNAQPVDLFQLQRLKKRKLVLKDMILKLESDLLPDIIA